MDHMNWAADFASEYNTMHAILHGKVGTFRPFDLRWQLQALPIYSILGSYNTGDDTPYQEGLDGDHRVQAKTYYLQEDVDLALSVIEQTLKYYVPRNMQTFLDILCRINTAVFTRHDSEHDMMAELELHRLALSGYDSFACWRDSFHPKNKGAYERHILVQGVVGFEKLTYCTYELLSAGEWKGLPSTKASHFPSQSPRREKCSCS